MIWWTVEGGEYGPEEFTSFHSALARYKELKADPTVWYASLEERSKTLISENSKSVVRSSE